MWLIGQPLVCLSKNGTHAKPSKVTKPLVEHEFSLSRESCQQIDKGRIDVETSQAAVFPHPEHVFDHVLSP